MCERVLAGPAILQQHMCFQPQQATAGVLLCLRGLESTKTHQTGPHNRSLSCGGCCKGGHMPLGSRRCCLLLPPRLQCDNGYVTRLSEDR